MSHWMKVDEITAFFMLRVQAYCFSVIPYYTFCVGKNFWSILLMLYFQILSNCLSSIPFMCSILCIVLAFNSLFFSISFDGLALFCSTRSLHTWIFILKQILVRKDQKMVNYLLNQNVAMCALFKLQSLSAKAVL